MRRIGQQICSAVGKMYAMVRGSFSCLPQSPESYSQELYRNDAVS